MTLMEFSMIPLDKGESFSRYVARSLDIIDQSGLDYRLTPMGTVVEGEWDQLTDLLSHCFKSMSSYSKRVSVSVKFDHREGRTGRLAGKVKAVEEKVGRSLKTSEPD